MIGIGGDNSHLSNEKDQYDHVMSPFHREFSVYFLLNVRFFLFDFIEDENAPALPTLGDHEPHAGEQNDNRMDIDQGLQHIPGADDTTLLSNVSDEFVLPPISTTGKINKNKKPRN